MNEYHVIDMPALINRLNEFKSLFDQKLLAGENFEEVKKIYMEIKEIESQLKGTNTVRAEMK